MRGRSGLASVATRVAKRVATRVATLVALAVAVPLAAQDFAFTPRVQPELRAELAAAHYPSALVMAGANVPLGYYVRAGIGVGAGLADVHGDRVLATRADVEFRFLLDPFAQARWGPYAGGGLTVRREGTDSPRAGLLVVLGVEGRRLRRLRRWTPAVEVALGEGARLAFVLRKARTNGR